MTISIYYGDPEGNYVELQSDNFADWKLSTEYRRTRAFAENPIDEMEEIGIGTHQRIVIDLRSFNERLAKKGKF